MKQNSVQSGVVDLAFLRRDFEILALFQRSWLFLKIRKQDKIWLFSVEKDCLWQNIV